MWGKLICAKTVGLKLEALRLCKLVIRTAYERDARVLGVKLASVEAADSTCTYNKDIERHSTCVYVCAIAAKMSAAMCNRRSGRGWEGTLLAVLMVSSQD